MNTPAPGAQPSPEYIFETLNSFQRTAALKAAIELDVFTAIDEGKRTAVEIARAFKASERGIRILCDYLVIFGFLTKQGETYGLTPDAAMFLSRRSPACLGSTTKFLTTEEFMNAFKVFTESVRKGGTAYSECGTVEPNNPLWVEFARSMAPLMYLPSQKIAEVVQERKISPRKILDIAAGHGLFGIALARRNPAAEVYALDWPAVLEVAKTNAQDAGVAARHHSIPGSAFEVEFGSGYDLVLLTNFLHHFDPPTNEKLLRKVHAALAPGGSVIALEFVPNEDRVSPRAAAAFAVIMLGTTPSGDAYTFSEYRGMFTNAGFRSVELCELPPTIQRLVIAGK